MLSNDTNHLNSINTSNQINDNPTWPYRKDLNTGNVYKIDFGTSEGMSLANDPNIELIRISKNDYRKYK